MHKDKGISRRGFLKSAVSSVGAFTIVPRHVLGGATFTAPRRAGRVPQHPYQGIGVTAADIV